MSTVKSNFIWNSLYQIIRIFIPLVTMPVVTRALGSDNLGIYSYTYSIALYGTYFILLGLNQYGNREIAKVRDDKRLISKTFWSIFFGQFVIGCIVTLIYLLFYVSLEGAYRLFFMIWAIWLVAEIVDISWFFFGMEEFRIISMRNTLIRVLAVIAIVLFVRVEDDLWLYCFIQSLAFAMNSVILWMMFKGRVGFYKPAAKEVLRHIPPNLKLFAPVIAISCYTQLNNILLGYLTNMSQVAFYDNSNKITLIPLAIIQSLGMVLLPRMSRELSRGRKADAIRFIGSSMWLSIAMSFGLFFGIVGVSFDFVPLFFGPDFEECVQLIPLLSLIIVPCAISSVFGNQWLLPQGKDGLYLCSVLLGALVNIVLCLALIPQFQAVGAAVAAIAAEIVVAASQAIFIKGSLPLARYARDSLPFLLAGGVELVCIKLISGLGIDPFPRLIMEIIAGIAVFVVVSFVILVIKHDEHLALIGLKRFQRR